MTQRAVSDSHCGMCIEAGSTEHRAVKASSKVEEGLMGLRRWGWEVSQGKRMWRAERMWLKNKIKNGGHKGVDYTNTSLNLILMNMVNPSTTAKKNLKTTVKTIH